MVSGPQVPGGASNICLEAHLLCTRAGAPPRTPAVRADLTLLLARDFLEENGKQQARATGERRTHDLRAVRECRRRSARQEVPHQGSPGGGLRQIWNPRSSISRPLQKVASYEDSRGFSPDPCCTDCLAYGTTDSGKAARSCARLPLDTSNQTSRSASRSAQENACAYRRCIGPAWARAGREVHGSRSRGEPAANLEPNDRNPVAQPMNSLRGCKPSLAAHRSQRQNSGRQGVGERQCSTTKGSRAAPLRSVQARTSLPALTPPLNDG